MALYILLAAAVIVAVVATFFTVRGLVRLRKQRQKVAVRDANRTEKVDELRKRIRLAQDDPEIRRELFEGSRDTNTYTDHNFQITTWGYLSYVKWSEDEKLLSAFKAVIELAVAESGYARDKSRLSTLLSPWLTERTHESSQSLLTYIRVLKSAESDTQLRLGEELGLDLATAQATLQSFWSETYAELSVRAPHDLKALQELQLLITDSDNYWAKEAGMTKLAYPSAWNSWVAALYKQPGYSDFVGQNYITDLPAGTLRARAAHALATRDLTEARIVLSYLDIGRILADLSDRKEWVDMGLIARTEVGDSLMAALAVFVEERVGFRSEAPTS